MGLIFRSKETAPCTVTISHRFEELSAHVKFNNGAVIHPGDSVLVHGGEIMAPYGEVVEEDRTATITRASKLEQLWTRATGDLEFMELCEFSFSDEVFPASGNKEVLS
ncbi:MAG: hypothetical protein P1U53_08325 [Sulfitobacter sp.]|nr:hypothetical protein [Sulfitobacter sp.]